jgi:hypothetical protein
MIWLKGDSRPSLLAPSDRARQTFLRCSSRRLSRTHSCLMSPYNLFRTSGVQGARRNVCNVVEQHLLRGVCKQPFQPVRVSAHARTWLCQPSGLSQGEPASLQGHPSERIEFRAEICHCCSLLQFGIAQATTLGPTHCVWVLRRTQATASCHDDGTNSGLLPFCLHSSSASYII